MRILQRSMALAFSFVLVAACSNDLERAALVAGPRILAIVTDPPEAAPGQDVHVRVLAVDPHPPDPMHPRELRYTFRLCIDPQSFFGGFTPDGTQGLDAPAIVCLPLRGNGNTATVPGALLQTVTDALPMYAAQAHLDPAPVEQALATYGIPLQIRVAVSAIDPATGTETTLISGVKQFGLTMRAQRTTNPPYVYFAIGKSVFLGGLPNGSFECTLWFSDPPSFPASVVDPGDNNYEKQRYAVLSPLDNPFDWMETYPYLDYSSQLRTGREGAYYSWYTSSDRSGHCVVPAQLGGREGQDQCHTIVSGDETTQVSATAMRSDPQALAGRDAVWILPRVPGTYDVWLVVRDGHLGESACHTTIEVTAP